MNVGQATIALRERRTLETLDLCLPYIKKVGARTYGKLALALLAPTVLGLLVLRHAAGVSWWLIWPLAIASSKLLEGAFTIAAGQLMFTLDVPLIVVLRRFLSALPRYLKALLWSRFLIAIALVTVVLAPMLLVRHLFLPEVVLLENVSRGALSRSRRLSASGPALELLGSLWLATAFLIVTSELVFQAIIDTVLQFGEPFGGLWESGGSVYALLGLFASTPLVATARFLAYVDLRTRSDGWDVQVRFQRILLAAQKEADR